MARFAALSTQALAYFLQAVLNAAIGFQAVYLMHPTHMLRGLSPQCGVRGPSMATNLRPSPPSIVIVLWGRH